MTRPFAVAAAAAVLALTAACSGSSSKPAAAPDVAAATSTAAQPTMNATCNLPHKGDVIERIVTPGNEATAQELGDVDEINCQSTFDSLKAETPSGPGYCTQAAWLSDNPNYNVDAVPAPPLKKIQAQAGQGC